MAPASDFYKKLALDCTSDQIAVDLFAFGGNFIDLATICKAICTQLCTAYIYVYIPSVCFIDVHTYLCVLCIVVLLWGQSILHYFLYCCFCSSLYIKVFVGTSSFLS